MLNLQENIPWFVLNDILNWTIVMSFLTLTIIIYNGYYKVTQNKILWAEMKLFNSSYKWKETLKLITKNLVHFGVLRNV